MTFSKHVPPNKRSSSIFVYFILFIFLLNNLMFVFLDPFVEIQMSHLYLFDILFSRILYFFYNIFLDQNEQCTLLFH